MELRQIQYFVAVYEQGSVTRAAQRLNVVQPALSQQVSKLEDELGRKLFQRTPKGMVATRAGEEAYGYFSTILQDMETARRNIMNESGVVSGSVAIGVVSSVVHNALGETLRSFSRKFPEVTVRATGGYTTELTDMLNSGELDVVIVNAAPQVNKRDMTDIVTEDLALIGSTKNAKRFRGPVTLEALGEVSLVMPTQRHGLRHIIDRAAAAQQVSLSPQIEVDEIKTIEDLVRSTEYFTILPPIAMHRMLAKGQLTARQITPRIPRRLVYVTHPNRPLTTAAQLLVDEVRERMIDALHDLGMSLEGAAR
ncbi:LysR family transcriptional regulator [Tepidamorphus sp. 3E244]|uniref:LysR family transcriptional regulator n=1 Tax=Tepidamorphus sp. 3E244 TaxID=3385498 RepID=UPI0038FC802C